MVFDNRHRTDRPGTARRGTDTSGMVHGPVRPPRFAPTDHLAAEAVAAFVDGELRFSAHMRAARHLEMCVDCAAEVEAQGAARSALRTASAVTMPSDLLGQLTRIPTSEIDLRDTARDDPARGPLSAPGFPVHRTHRWRGR